MAFSAEQFTEILKIGLAKAFSSKIKPIHLIGEISIAPLICGTSSHSVREESTLAYPRDHSSNPYKITLKNWLTHDVSLDERIKDTKVDTPSPDVIGIKVNEECLASYRNAERLRTTNTLTNDVIDMPEHPANPANIDSTTGT